MRGVVRGERRRLKTVEAEFSERVLDQQFARRRGVPVPLLVGSDPVGEFPEPVHLRVRLLPEQVDEPDRLTVDTDEEARAVTVASHRSADPPLGPLRVDRRVDAAGGANARILHVPPEEGDVFGLCRVE
jgi:hypothetical protein